MSRKIYGGIGAALTILLVILAFSGIASSDTSRTVLVSPEIPAWDELISPEIPAWDELISPEIPAWDELVSDAWNESVAAVTHEEQQLVSNAYWVWSCDIYDWIDAVYQHHDAVPAVYETQTIVDQAAYDEQVLVTAAYDEQVVDVAGHYVTQEADHSGHYLNAAGQVIQPGNLNAQKYNIGTVKYGFIVYDDTGCGVNHKWKAVSTQVWVPTTYKNVHHDAVYTNVHHDAVTHDVQVLVTPEVPAWDELVSAGHYQYLGHMDVQTAPDGYNDMISQCSAAYPGWNMICHPHSEFAAQYQTVIVEDEPAYVIEHPAVFAHHDAVPAVFQHHDAVPAVWLHHDITPAVWKIITAGDTVVDDNGVQEMVDEAGNLIPTGNIVNTNPTFCSA